MPFKLLGLLFLTEPQGHCKTDHRPDLAQSRADVRGARPVSANYLAPAPLGILCKDE